MADLKKYIWRWLKCFCTGGHRYADKNLVSHYNPNLKKYIFANACVKCGKAYVVAIDKMAIEQDLEGRY